MEHMPALKVVFPDALVVVSIRTRAAVDRSMARCLDLIASRQRTRPVPFRYWPTRFDAMAERYARDAPQISGIIEVPLAERSGAQRLVWAAIDEPTLIRTMNLG